MQEAQFLNGLYIFIILILSIATIILVKYSISLRSYLKEFMKVSKDISNKQFDSIVKGQMSGEIGIFANNFNSMILAGIFLHYFQGTVLRAIIDNN